MASKFANPDSGSLPPCHDTNVQSGSVEGRGIEQKIRKMNQPRIIGQAGIAK